VDFQGHYKFGVRTSATLVAVGTEADSIVFTCDTLRHPDGWYNLRLWYASDDSRISYCRLEYGNASGTSWPDGAGGAILCYNSSPTISENTIRCCSASNGGGIFCSSSDAILSGNTIIDNLAGEHGGGLFLYRHFGVVSSNLISDNHSGGGAGIYSERSTPEIIDNAITGNSTGGRGGGIGCYHSGPIIRDNTISENVSGNGGGISFFGSCTPEVTGNSISGNTVTGEHGYGGGIECVTAPGYTEVIRENTITGNHAVRGGGIGCYWSSPEIMGNTIRDNSATFGGGIACVEESEPTIGQNSVFENTAYRGGGIYCLDSSPTVSGNTVNENRADRGGGGVFCENSRPTIANTILWGDTAVNGPEIFVRSGDPPIVRYCDVQGGWPGTGNIDADPLFAGPYNDDFHLRWHSPCINAGHPSLTDPDGTRSDIGAFYFNLAVLGIVEVYPHDEPIMIPPQGGDITYDGGVLNLSRGDLTVDIWAQTFVPGLIRPYRLWRYNDVTIPFADSLIRAELVEHVPGYAPSGDYSFVTYIGDFPSSIIDSSCMYFTKEGAAYTSGEGNGWEALKGWFNGCSEIAEATLPTAYSLSQNYPNPFNATTTIKYQLPAEGDVKLEVYNLFGQKVATLVDGKQQAGYRSVNWDASEISSGLYFYKLTVGDFTETRRMMLVK